MNAAYPPRRHQEYSLSKMQKIIDNYCFATIISNGAEIPFVTHIPVILNRTQGQFGTLFGHMDRFNPHSNVLTNQPVLAVFHGPNSYISPSVYNTSQLPTWNSISVHAIGKVRLIESNAELVEKLVKISNHADQTTEPSYLNPQDDRIPNLIDYIIGFEIEILSLEGKFKLSQDRGPEDQELAKKELVRKTELSQREVIDFVYN